MVRAADVAFVLGGVLVLVWAFVGVAGVCRMSPKDLVTLQDLEEKVDGMDWIQIYVFEDRSNQNYGKCNVRWNLPPDSDGFIRRQLICYNFNYEACEDFERALKRSVDECGRAQENAENRTTDAKFFSQDPSQYLWYDSCYEYADDGSCSTPYLDLLVKANRVLDTPNQSLDLYQLPWDKISEDLVNNFNLTITDTLVRFTWLGDECWYDGRGRPTNASSKLSSKVGSHYRGDFHKNAVRQQRIIYS